MNIFIVDDDRGTLNALRIGLVSRGHQVETADSGQKALEILPSLCKDPLRRPSILLTDLKMPGINGLELIRQVRKRLPDLPCILMSAYGNDAVFKKASQIRGCITLDKPFRAESLFRRISELVKEAPVQGVENTRETTGVVHVH